MIGRGCLKNPWIFMESMNRLNKSEMVIHRDFILLTQKLRSYLESFYEPRIQMLQIKKFCAWFSAGYPDSSHFRKQIFLAKSQNEQDDLINDYFLKLKDYKPKDTSDEPFLMGGHG